MLLSSANSTKQLLILGMKCEPSPTLIDLQGKQAVILISQLLQPPQCGYEV